MTIFRSRVPIYGKKLIQEIEETIDEQLLMTTFMNVNQMLNDLEHIAERQQVPSGELLLWYMNYVNQLNKEREGRHDD